MSTNKRLKGTRGNVMPAPFVVPMPGTDGRLNVHDGKPFVGRLSGAFCSVLFACQFFF
jgi:hypothetical protein